MNHRATRFLVGAVAVMSLTTACWAPEPRPRDPVTEGQLVGKWQGDCGATLDMARDGAVRLEDFPVEYGGIGSEPRRTSGDGTWRIAPPIEDIQPQELDVLKDRQHYGVEFRLHESRTESGEEVQELMLWWSVGDPDSPFRCEFLAEPS